MNCRSSRTTSLAGAFLLFAAVFVLAPPAEAGQLYDVGGHRLMATIAGAGKAAVVFENGMGEDESTWSRVAPEVAKFARVFTYDRAGLGQSENVAGRHSMTEMVDELHVLLRASAFRGPYVLVGHSLGGELVQVFAHRYPSDTAGLVLVDPEDGRLTDAIKAHMSPTDWAAREKAVEEAMPKMPPPIARELTITQASAAEALAAQPLPEVPTVLLTGTKKNPEFPGNPLEQDLKLDLHNGLVRQMPGIKHVLVPESRHYIQNDRPDLVIKAIHEVVQKAGG